MKREYSYYLKGMCLLLFMLSCREPAAQTAVPFTGDRWTIDSQAHLVTTYRGKEALYLVNGAAILEDLGLRNGVLEFEIAFSGERGFTGVTWRIRDNGNYEDFYLRPHLSGQPDANQYTPVFNGVTGWQLYFGEAYSTPVYYRLNEWMPVKVVFWEEQARIYVDDMEDPILEVARLKQEPASGSVALRAFTTPAYFSGFSYTPLTERPFGPLEETEPELPAGTVREFEVSNTFEEGRLDPAGDLRPGEWSALEWQPLEIDGDGMANLARLHGVEGEANTLFARFTVRSDRRQYKRLRFGYSDKVRVYVNGVPVYGGDNTYTSRDYRYLGTMGLFDEIYLPLEEGENEIRFAVSEAFGGWGIMARFEDLEGIEVAGDR